MPCAHSAELQVYSRLVHAVSSNTSVFPSQLCNQSSYRSVIRCCCIWTIWGLQYHTTTTTTTTTTMFLWWLCWWYFVSQVVFRTETYCCQGYLKDVLGRCVAHCDGGCANGVCRTPNNCTCYPGYTLDRSGNCVVECPCGCLNGVCAGITAFLFVFSLASVTSNSLPIYCDTETHFAYKGPAKKMYTHFNERKLYVV